MEADALHDLINGNVKKELALELARTKILSSRRNGKISAIKAYLRALYALDPLQKATIISPDPEKAEREFPSDEFPNVIIWKKEETRPKKKIDYEVYDESVPNGRI